MQKTLLLVIMLLLCCNTNTIAQRKRKGKRGSLSYWQKNSIAANVMNQICCEQEWRGHLFTKAARAIYHQESRTLALEVEEKATGVVVTNEEIIGVLVENIYSMLLNTRLNETAVFRELSQYYIHKDTTFDIFKTNIELKVHPDAKDQFYFIYTLSVFDEGRWKTKEWLVERLYCEDRISIQILQDDYIPAAILDKNKAMAKGEWKRDEK